MGGKAAMSTPEIRELESKLRAARKAEKKKRAVQLGHPAKKQGAAYSVGDHEYLTDPVAFTKRRMEIFRNAGGKVTWFNESDPWTVEEIEPATCQGCVEPHLTGWMDGEWHHNCELSKHCDSAACALYVCRVWHRAHHNRVVKFLHRGAAERREQA
jgi:hypothetical protein